MLNASETGQEYAQRIQRAARFRKYGLTEQQFLDMLSEQAYECAICSVDLTERTAMIDHDHKTKEVRKLLCINCNTGLGSFKDNGELLLKAADYLKGARC